MVDVPVVAAAGLAPASLHHRRSLLLGPSAGRVIVPIRDAAAHATFYLLARTDCRQEAENLFDWVSR